MKAFLPLMIGLLSLTVAGCHSYDEEEEISSSHTAKQHKARFYFDILKHNGNANSINQDNVDKEDAVSSVVVAGVAQSAYHSTGAYIDLPSANTTRSYFFAANLTDADQTTLKNSQNGDRIELNTLDYLGNNGKLKTGSFFPMVAALTNVKATDFNLAGTGVNPPYKYKSDVQFTRVFARLDYKTANLPSGVNIQKVSVINVPQKFALGSSIVDYDVKVASTTYAYTEFNLPTTLTSGELDGFVYLPEHAVQNPTFFDPDIHHMTCLRIEYTDAEGAKEVLYRIANRSIDKNGTAAQGRLGKLMRNHVYSAVIDWTKIKHYGDKMKGWIN